MATKTVSIVTGGANSAPTTAAELQALATDFFSPGIVSAVSLNSGSGGTGGYAINAQGTPNMSVRISAGVAYVTATPTGGSSVLVRVNLAAFEDLTISANATGSTRYDWVYIKIDPDKLAAPGVNKDDVATLVTSRSTSNTADDGTAPTYNYKLGIVTVANNASTITNSNITDSRIQTGPNSYVSSAWTAWTPTFTGFSAAPTVTTARYIQIGKTVILQLTSTAGTSNANSFTFTLPVTAKNAGNFMAANITDNTVTAATSGMVALSASSATATVFKDGASTAWTTSGSKNANIGLLIYEAA